MYLALLQNIFTENQANKTRRFNQSSKYHKNNLLCISHAHIVFETFYICFKCNFRFIQVIQSAGKPLRSGFYNLITHTEVE